MTEGRPIYEGKIGGLVQSFNGPPFGMPNLMSGQCPRPLKECELNQTRIWTMI